MDEDQTERLAQAVQGAVGGVSIGEMLAALREAKNRVCIDGHTNAALDDILRHREPDAIMSTLTWFAHRAVEIGFNARTRFHFPPTGRSTAPATDAIE